MRTCSLQSGSNGNAIYVEAGGVRLLFDAGISGRQAWLRLAEYGIDIRSVDALILSHDHADHVSCAGIYQRLFGLPIYVTAPTFGAIRNLIGPVEDIRYFSAGQTLSFGPALVHTIPTPHDAQDGVAFLVECGGKRLGILTDLGHPFDGLEELLDTLDAAYLESNYDPHLLATGPYPPQLQERIRGPGGHLSNFEAAHLLRRCRRRHAWVTLAHLSEQNNNPTLALRTHRRVIGDERPLYVASRYEASPLFSL
jgi:phosphoribosyl 1,2-cyclic phosphodiesterase